MDPNLVIGSVNSFLLTLTVQNLYRLNYAAIRFDWLSAMWAFVGEFFGKFDSTWSDPTFFIESYLGVYSRYVHVDII